MLEQSNIEFDSVYFTQFQCKLIIIIIYLYICTVYIVYTLSTTLTNFGSLDYTMTAYTSLANRFLRSQISREIILNILDAYVYQEFISRQNGATYVCISL